MPERTSTQLRASSEAWRRRREERQADEAGCSTRAQRTAAGEARFTPTYEVSAGVAWVVFVVQTVAEDLATTGDAVNNQSDGKAMFEQTRYVVQREAFGVEA